MKRAVYAKKDFPKGTLLGTYEGKVFTRKEWERSEATSCYVLPLTRDRFVQVEENHWVAFLNAPESCGKWRVNAKATRHGTVRVQKHIQAGEEVFVEFGSMLWSKKAEDEH